MIRKGIITIVYLVLIFSCEKKSDDSCIQFDIDYSTEYNLHNKWTFLGFQDLYKDKIDCKPSDLIEMDIEFRNDNSFHARSSCNTFDGSFKLLNNDSINLFNIKTTLKGCMGDKAADWEDKYYNGLENAMKYKIAGNKLSIETLNKNKMIFKINN